MDIRIGNTDIVAILALALLTALLPAIRFRPKSWLEILIEAHRRRRRRVVAGLIEGGSVGTVLRLD